MKYASRFLLSVSAFALSSMAFVACQPSSTDLNMPQLQQDPMVIPAHFPKPVVPASNPMTPAKVELGHQLFYDVRLSSTNTQSCAGCHSLAASFSDRGQPVSLGARGQRGFRNAPALMNVAYDTVFFWDGRATSLEKQALGPITNPVELANDSNTVVATLKNIPFYEKLFADAFGDGAITFTRIGQALASFERTFISGSSLYDQFYVAAQHGDSSALSASALRGFKLFNSKEVNCVGCHKGVTFTDNAYHSTGLDFNYADQGREDVTNSQGDNGKFRTPSLRNIALTTPYMHDGRFTTLTQVLAHYNEGGKHNTNQDTLIHALKLKDSQVNDIIEFLNSLTDNQFTNTRAFANPFN